MTTRHRPTVAVVDLEAIRHNVRLLRPPRAGVMAVVKANGYGHGAVPVSRAALEAGASWLGVALVEEGIQLRDAGIDAPILVLTQFPPQSEKEALAARLSPTVYTDDGLERLEAAAASVGGRVGVHVKVDTGMHRVGVAPELAPQLVDRVLASGLELEGLWTHFASSEDPADPSTGEQIDRFRSVVDRLGEAGVRPAYLHAANSAASIGRPETHLDLVRLGIALYGISPGPGVTAPADLRPAMSWTSVVALAKRLPAGERISYGLHYRLDQPSTIATVPVGYADGYARRSTGKGHVLIRGKRHPIAGTVTMDQLMVDCGDDPVEAGDEVVLIGRQGDQVISAGDVAGWTGTIAYEVVCAVSDRVPRVYLGGSEAESA